VFTGGNHNAKIRRIYYKRRFFGMRHFLKPSKRLPPDELIPRIKYYFPKLVFCNQNNIGKSILPLDIEKYFNQVQGIWTLDVPAMSKNDYYKHLFPKKEPDWDEEKAISRYGKPDVIKYFVNMENDCFLTEFSKIKNKPEHFNEKYISDIPNEFLKDFEYDNNPYWEDWDFTKVVGERHSPTSIYEAFRYYARRYYTLLTLALTDMSFNCKDPDNYKFEHLTKIAEKKLKEYYPELTDKVHKEEELYLKINHGKEDLTQMSGKLISERYFFVDVLQYALQCKSKKSINEYVPTEPATFIGNFKSSIFNLDRMKRQQINQKKWDPHGLSIDLFNDGEKTKINDLFNKLEIDKNDFEGEKEFSELKFLGKHKGQGNHKRKITLLYKQISNQSVRQNYSKAELEDIKKLYLKLYYCSPTSLDEVFIDDKNGGGKDTLHNRVESKDPEIEKRIYESLPLRPIFENGLKSLFSNEVNMKSFMVDLYEFLGKDIDIWERYDGKKLKMTKYAKREIWELYCTNEGIQIDVKSDNDPDDPLKNIFIDSLLGVIDDIGSEFQR
jgi:hypothetical protein